MCGVGDRTGNCSSSVQWGTISALLSVAEIEPPFFFGASQLCFAGTGVVCWWCWYSQGALTIGASAVGCALREKVCY